jgi:hypothetical protein
MLLKARDHVSEAGTRNRFMRRLCETGRAYAISGSEGLVRVKSKRWKGRDVTLLWSESQLAQKYLMKMGTNARIKELTVGEIIQDVTPALERFRRFIGPDWGMDPAETELEPRDVSDRLRVEAVNSFVARVTKQGVLWILEGADGPGLLLSGSNPDLQALPCWSLQEEAEKRIVGPFEEMLAVAIPLHNFIGRTLPWLKECNRLVAPEHYYGGGAIELDPEELRFRLHPDLVVS